MFDRLLHFSVFLVHGLKIDIAESSEPGESLSHSLKREYDSTVVIHRFRVRIGLGVFVPRFAFPPCRTGGRIV